MDNYRPISIIPTVSKLLERAVHHQLYQYLREHNILSPFQCGFRKCHSTKFAALSLADTIRRNIDQRMLTGAVFIDFRKAFDTVNHDLLLQKLSYMGVLDKELAWFKDYLHDRTQVWTSRVYHLTQSPFPLQSRKDPFWDLNYLYFM